MPPHHGRGQCVPQGSIGEDAGDVGTWPADTDGAVPAYLMGPNGLPTGGGIEALNHHRSEFDATPGRDNAVT